MEHSDQSRRSVLRRIGRRALFCLAGAIVVQVALFGWIAYSNQLPALGVQGHPNVAKLTAGDQVHLRASTVGRALVFYDDVYINSAHVTREDSQLVINADPDRAFPQFFMRKLLSHISEISAAQTPAGLPVSDKNFRASGVMIGWPFLCLQASLVSPLQSLADGRADGLWGIETPRPGIRLRPPRDKFSHVRAADGSLVTIASPSSRLDGVLPLGIMWTPAIMNTILFIAAVYVLIVSFTIARAVPRSFGNRCLFCGYPRKDLGDRPCPECGNEPPDSLIRYLRTIWF